MHDLPCSTDLLQSVITFLNDAAIPKLTGREAFDAKVAARALGIVQRELKLGPQAAERERDGLRRLLGHDGALDELNQLLCEGIEQSRFVLETPGLTDHLWTVTLDKLAIDQPNYPSYRAHLAACGRHPLENQE